MATLHAKRDLTDLFLVLMALGLAAGFAAFAMPSLVSIFTGTYREMAMPDGSRITLSTDIQGLVGLARRGDDIEISGWAYDRRTPERGVLILVFAQGHIIARGVTDLQEDDVGRDAGLKVATPRFVIHFPAKLAPADPNETVRIFAIGDAGQGREIFKGGRAVHITEDAAPKTTK